MPKCPINKNIECDYISRAAESARQIDYAANHNYKYSAYEHVDCPAMPEYCIRLNKLKQQQR